MLGHLPLDLNLGSKVFPEMTSAAPRELPTQHSSDSKIIEHTELLDDSQFTSMAKLNQTGQV